ncbi:Zn-dependent M28 family amino/carboxypeptidase [Rhodococcus sp. 27YEA15]|uniref:M28 family peptidase n=1 Tax=Rhodococcus sp. 27YEA15 TaxID=3156259 RepID=UPI003C7CC6F9
MRLRVVAAVTVTGILTLASCTATQDGVDVLNPSDFADTVTVDAVTGHLEELERIADEHGGNRAVGTVGYDASVDYVVDVLTDRGFDVSAPEFEIGSFDTEVESLRGGDGRSVPVHALTNSVSTGPEGIDAPVMALPKDASLGCAATDYDGTDAAGAIVLVNRGQCRFGEKESIAADRGAAALIVVDPSGGTITDGTVGEPGASRIPTGSVTGDDARALAASDAPARLVLATHTQVRHSRNVVAQTRTGSTGDVVVVGAHLDSVDSGPGINDNGTGVAAILETALRLGGSPNVENAVRFAFWGGEEEGLLGSAAYVENLTDSERADIALYLNFDMLGSPNAGYLVYDGDDSDDEGEGPGPDGSDGIERTFTEFFADRGIEVEGTDFDGRSDYGPFIGSGIPAGGVFSGADERKTRAQAQKWGGDADRMMDPNYHTARDILANVDREALAVNAIAVAYAVAVYANSVEGVNGVPVGTARTTARAEMSASPPR